MIFVTVGVHYKGFDRLVKKMDEIAGKINEKVIMQIGSTKYKPKNSQYFNFIESDDEILNLYSQARIVVSHAGAGSALTAIRLSKPTILVPRLKKYGEHIDDQQLELAEALSKEGKVIAVYDVEQLESSLKEADRLIIGSKKKESRLACFLKAEIEKESK